MRAKYHSFHYKHKAAEADVDGDKYLSIRVSGHGPKLRVEWGGDEIS